MKAIINEVPQHVLSYFDCKMVRECLYLSDFFKFAVNDDSQAGLTYNLMVMISY